MKDNTIGSQGLQQGGKELGNDYSRDLTREKQESETAKIIVEKGQKKTDKKTPVERNGERHR